MQQIHYFLVLCQELSFTRAARRCGVAQPSLTTAISALERDLGGALFHRKPAIALTGLGHRVLPYLDEIVRSADCAREVARTLTPRPDADRSARDDGCSELRIDAADARRFAQVGLRRTAASARNGVLG